MKKILIALFLFCGTLNSFAIGRVWYFSAAGNDASGDGTVGNPYLTIQKLNTLWASINPGDQILFRAGDVFQGSIIIGKSGTVGNTITIGSYGMGTATISGMRTLSTWTNVGGNNWECPASFLKDNVNILTINDIPQAIGRTDWISYSSATSTQITSSTISSLPNYVGGEIVVRANTFVTEKLKITGQALSTITYTLPAGSGIFNNNASAPIAGKAGYGFFIQRDSLTLDQQGEWYFSPTRKKMRLYSTINPNTLTIEASAIDTVIAVGSRNYIIVDNINVEGGGVYGLFSNNGIQFTLQNSSFNNNTIAAYCWVYTDLTIINNTVDNSMCAGIVVNRNSSGNGLRANIKNNLINHTGQLIGNGVFNKDYSLCGMIAFTDTSRINNYINVIGNKVLNSGNAGIRWQGSNARISKNFTDTSANRIDDMGGIYTFVNTGSVDSRVFTNRIVDSNFIGNVIGATPGSASGNPDVTGLYFDDQTQNVLAYDNVIWNVPGNGIQLNTPYNMYITGNIIYNTDYSVSINKKDAGNYGSNRITKNIAYQKLNTQYNFFYTNNQLGAGETFGQALQNMAYIDSNWITNLKTSGYRFYYIPNGSTTYTFPPDFNFATWKSSYTHDLASTLPPIAVTGSNTHLHYNYKGSDSTLLFPGLRYIDPKGNVHDNSLVMPTSTGVILMDYGTSAANVPPTVDAGPDKTITLPVDFVTVTGTAFPNGTGVLITSTVWTGADGTILNHNNLTTLIQTLTEGDHTFTLTATDTNGEVYTNDMIVHVLPEEVIVPAGKLKCNCIFRNKP